MTPEQFKALKPGDIICHKNSSQALIVHDNDGERVTAVRVTVASNHCEWDLVARSKEEAKAT